MGAPDDEAPATAPEPSAVPIDAPRGSDAAAVALPPQPDSDDGLTQAGQPHSNKKTPDETALAFLGLIEQGVGAREAATECGLNLRTAYGVLARSDADVDALRAATRKLLAAGTAERIEDWRTAARVGAAKKGNHAPARDWLLHAGVIDAVDSDSPNVRIAINIGTDDAPMRIASPLRYKTDED